MSKIENEVKIKNSLDSKNSDAMNQDSTPKDKEYIINKDKIIKPIKPDFSQVKQFLEKPFLNSTEASLFLGLQKSTIYQYTHSHRLPYYKQGKLIYFARTDLIKFALDPDNRVMSQSELLAVA